jgi:DNA repair exonuclease SbcCD ATPase subunit
VTSIHGKLSFIGLDHWHMRLFHTRPNETCQRWRSRRGLWKCHRIQPLLPGAADAAALPPDEESEQFHAVEALRADLLRREREQRDDESLLLRQVADVLEHTGDLADLPGVAAARLKVLKSSLRKLGRVYKTDSDEELLSRIVADSALLVHFQEFLTDALDYTGEPADLPSYAADYIRALVKRTSEDAAHFRGELALVKQQYQAEAAKAEAGARDAEARLAEAEARAVALAAALASATEGAGESAAQAADAQKTVAEVARNYTDLENEFQALRAENAALVEQLAKRTERDQKRTAQLLDAEREQHQEELRSLRQQLAPEIARLREAVDRKRARCRALKEKNLTITADFAKASEAVKANVATLERRHKKEVAEKTALIVARTAELKGLEAQNEDLQRRVDGLGERLARADALREDALKARVAELEHALDAHAHPPAQPKAQLAIDKKAQDGIADWENWARRTYSNVTQGELFRDGSRALRRRLGEMLVGALDQTALHAKIRSLRVQKEVLRSGKPLLPTGQEEPSFWTVIVIGMALTRMRRDLALPTKG